MFTNPDKATWSYESTTDKGVIAKLKRSIQLLAVGVIVLLVALLALAYWTLSLHKAKAQGQELGSEYMCTLVSINRNHDPKFRPKCLTYHTDK